MHYTWKLESKNKLVLEGTDFSVSYGFDPVFKRKGFLTFKGDKPQGIPEATLQGAKSFAERMHERENPDSKATNRKNYGSIGHLPSSRMGPSDHHVHEGQQRICTEKARDKHDVIIVTEKLDGSNVGIARIGDAIHALGRAGYLAQTSKYEQHQLFAAWVREHEEFWREVLGDGQRLVGEWLAQAHGTRYVMLPAPFVAFDLMMAEARAPFNVLENLCNSNGIAMLHLLHVGGPISVEDAMKLHADLHNGIHPEDSLEGIVYRVQRKGMFDFMAKFVRPDKIDGKYLPEVSGKDAVWNWRPEKRNISATG